MKAMCRTSVLEPRAIYQQMQEAGTRPDMYTFNTIISAAARAESGVAAADEWLRIMKSASVTPGPETFNVSLLHLAARSGTQQGATHGWSTFLSVSLL